MGYRTIEKKKPIRRVLQDTTTKNRTYVQNGATAHLAIPCWYDVVNMPQHIRCHHIDYHDHIGWPTPDHPDESCQDGHLDQMVPSNRYSDYHHGWMGHHKLLDMSMFYPIHLEEEGYTSVDVAFVNPPAGLTAEGYIDDYVVRFTLEPKCESAIEEDIDVPYTVFINGTIGTRTARDVVAKGVLHILSGAIS